MTAPAVESTLRAGAQTLYALQLLQAIGAGLSEADQEWLTAHLRTMPDYLRTKEGAQVMSAVVNCYRSYITRKGET